MHPFFRLAFLFSNFLILIVAIIATLDLDPTFLSQRKAFYSHDLFNKPFFFEKLGSAVNPGIFYILGLITSISMIILDGLKVKGSWVMFIQGFHVAFLALFINLLLGINDKLYLMGAFVTMLASRTVKIALLNSKKEDKTYENILYFLVTCFEIYPWSSALSVYTMQNDAVEIFKTIMLVILFFYNLADIIVNIMAEFDQRTGASNSVIIIVTQCVNILVFIFYLILIY